MVKRLRGCVETLQLPLRASNRARVMATGWSSVSVARVSGWLSVHGSSSTIASSLVD